MSDATEAQVEAVPEVTKPEPDTEPKQAPEEQKEEESIEAVAEPEVTNQQPDTETQQQKEEQKEDSLVVVPKPKYNPKHADVSRAKTYASILVADQEMMLANLRHMRRELAKEDRELKVLQKTLFNMDYPRKSTPPTSYRSEANLRGGSALIEISRMGTY